jgi:hypothetical protein
MPSPRLRRSGRCWRCTTTDCRTGAFVFPNVRVRHVGEPVRDVKNAFRTALDETKIADFTGTISARVRVWPMMKGASRRAVAELLGHPRLRMVKR